MNINTIAADDRLAGPVVSEINNGGKWRKGHSHSVKYGIVNIK